jgi:hypothetical protein
MDFILLICLAAFALGLGFFALLKQKTYLHANSGTVTAIELPLVGKLQTNYPALVFVAVGLAFGYLANKVRIDEAKETWTTMTPFTIEGQLTSKENVKDWSSTEITVIPSSLTTQQVSPSGKYRIVIEIPKWQSIDNWLEAITFQSVALSGRISRGAKNDTSKSYKKTEAYLNTDVSVDFEK